MELTTNLVLGGFTATIGMSMLVASIWLGRNVCLRIQRGGKTSKGGDRRRTISRIAKRDSVRIMLGFISMLLAVAVVFLMRLPLRAMREAGNESLGARWLEWSVYWETPAAVMVFIGLTCIMWPAFTKWARPHVSLAIAFVITAIVFVAAVIGIDVAAQALKP